MAVPGSLTAGFRVCRGGGGRGKGMIDNLDVLAGAIKAFTLTGTEADMTI